MTDKDMSVSFYNTTEEKTCKTLQSLDKNNNMSRKSHPCESNKITKWYIFLLYTS